MDRFQSYRIVIGERLKAFRKERNLTEAQVASKAGITIKDVHSVEDGSKNYPIDLFFAYVAGSDLYMYFATKGDIPGQADMIDKMFGDNPENKR